MALAQTRQDARTLTDLFPMPADRYRRGIERIAQDALGGEDISDRISAFARAVGVDPGMAANDIDEAITDLKETA